MILDTKKTFLFFATISCLFSFFLSCNSNISERYEGWETYRGTPDAIQFSALKEIDTSNVHLLKPAWVFHTGDGGDKSTIECNPIIIGNTMYITSPNLRLIALEASSGKELWRFEPVGKEQSAGVNRGVTYWTDGNKESIFFPAGSFLYSVIATTGKLDEGFGDKGKIDLRNNLGTDPSTTSISLTTPAIVYKNMVVLGSATGEGYNASPGHIRAYDAKTGAFIWIFHTIPQKGEYGYDTWKWVDGENYGGTNNWGGMSIDEKKGLVYVATGSPTYDFYGGNRIGDNLFANSIVALDVVSGKRKWHYQTVHHDLWDYDLPCAPNLVDITWKSIKREALVQPTKTGELIILDRNTGEQMLQPTEKPVSSSAIPNEIAAKTQPSNQGIPLMVQGWDSNRLTNISDSAKAYIQAEARKYINHGMFTPPSLQGTIGMPATRGGASWGGASYNPNTHVLFASCNEFPMIYQLEKLLGSGNDMEHEGQTKGGSIYLQNCSGCHGADRAGVGGVPGLMKIENRYNSETIAKIIRNGKGLMPAHTQFSDKDLQALVNFISNKKEAAPIAKSDGKPKGMEKYILKGFRLFTDKEGFPASTPPWGTLNAVDMQTGKMLWKVPLGFYPKLKERGIPNTGTQNFGGCVSTAGGLVFIAATADEMIRAYSAATGKELWNYKLPVGGYATPAVYKVNGKQYVVIAAGGGNRNGTPSSDTFIAFALPD